MSQQETIMAVFEVPGMTASQYEAIIEGLAATGLAQPEGRLYHVTGPRGDGWMVVDVWASAQHFERFGQTLMPIVQQLGLMPTPQIYPVHNLIEGE